MSRSRSLALVGAAALLLVSAAPVVAQDEATTDDTMDMEALAIDVGGVEYAFTNLPTSVPVGADPGEQGRAWGPSSEHSGGLVHHGFADAHAMSISTDVDPTVYMRCITRNGGEPVDTYELDY